MAIPMKAPTPKDLVPLRDEIAMQAMNAMIIAGSWGQTMEDGTHRKYANMRDYSDAAYEFADQMLAARERK